MIGTTGLAPAVAAVGPAVVAYTAAAVFADLVAVAVPELGLGLLLVASLQLPSHAPQRAHPEASPS
jgi:hypothetical protein